MTVFWVDANVLLRFLTREPPQLAERALRLIQRAEQGEGCKNKPTFVPKGKRVYVELSVSQKESIAVAKPNGY